MYSKTQINLYMTCRNRTDQCLSISSNVSGNTLMGPPQSTSQSRDRWKFITRLSYMLESNSKSKGFYVMSILPFGCI